MGRANCLGLGHRGYLELRLESTILERGLCHAISSFVEAMFWIAVAGKDGDFMATVLQPHSSINNEPFCSTYPQIGMEKEDRLRPFPF